MKFEHQQEQSSVETDRPPPPLDMEPEPIRNSKAFRMLEIYDRFKMQPYMDALSMIMWGYALQFLSLLCCFVIVVGGIVIVIVFL